MLNKKETMNELKRKSKEAGHSIKKRDCSYELYISCVKNFGSFNNAKREAGLEIKNKRIDKINKHSFVKDRDLVMIVSYLTFDGHIYKNEKAFYYSSKNINDLKKFERIIKRKFGVLGKYYLNNGGATDVKTHKYIIFSKLLSRELINLGTPKGDKANQSFKIPSWIITSQDLSKEYLKIAFFCEGSFKDELKRKPRISIGMSKTEKFLDSGINFMNNLKKMLDTFDIKTTKCYITGNRIRKKDNQLSRDIRFRINSKDNNKFIKKIGWLK